VVRLVEKTPPLNGRSARLGSLALALALGASCSSIEAPERTRLFLRGKTMGTTYAVTIAGAAPTLDRAQIEAEVAAILETIDARMSSWNPGSEVSRFNASRSTQWLDVSDDTQGVVAEALQVSRLSNGAFDVTAAPLIALWGFGSARPRRSPPSALEVSDAAARVGYSYLGHRAHPPALRKTRPDLEIDVSAIAKGFAVDRIADHLDGAGIENYLVEIGGELRGRGRREDGQPWSVAVQRPVEHRLAAQLIVRLEDRAMATSGDYRNYFETDGVRYAHVLDPRTGRPIAHGLASVTVIDPSATRADAVATALLALGPQDGLRLAEAEELAALFVVRDGDGFTERRTDAFERYVSQ
jgi:thiamine biosynthesis lipoprotein